MDPVSGLVEVLDAGGAARTAPVASIVHVCGTVRRPAGPRAASSSGCARAARSSPRRNAAGGRVGRLRRVPGSRAGVDDRSVHQDLNVANVGLPNFAENIRAAGGSAVQLAWRPPGGGDAAAGMRLARLLGDPRIEAANATALAPLPRARSPCSSTSCSPARRSPALDGERRILHAGPPIAWEDMCGPVRGAIAGAIAYEGWAATPREGAALAARGEIALEPCHHHAAVGPMAGIVSPSMPVWVVENATAGNRAYCNFNEGLGKVLRFGANSDAVLDRLRWMGTELCDVLQAGGALARRRRAAADHGAGAAHGRRGPQPQRGGDGPLVQAARPRAAHHRASGRRRAARDRVRRRQRPLLPEPVDGGLQGDARRGPRRRAQHNGHGDGPQRRELRDPRAAVRATRGSRRPPTRSTASSSPATASRTRPPTWATARSPRPRASAGSRWPRRPRSCSSSAARPPTRPSTPGGCGRSRSGHTPPSRCRR